LNQTNPFMFDPKPIAHEKTGCFLADIHNHRKIF
jgi:hypothetical protein